MRPRRVRLLMAVAASACWGMQCACTGTCTAEFESSIVVFARDANTNEAVCDATLTASDGVRTGTLEVTRFEGQECRYVVFGLGPGEYEVAVTHSQYVDARLHDVEVREDGCKIAGAVREVKLHRK